VGPDDEFVIVWQSSGSSGSDTSSTSIQSQRYSSQGARLGLQFQVNSYTLNNQSQPSVSVGLGGEFVIVWQSNGSSGSDLSSNSIQGQRYSSQGTPSGLQFQVNSYTPSSQSQPSVSVGQGGDFVIVWQSYGSDGLDTAMNSIQGQRYSSQGAPLGLQFEVNSYTTGDQRSASVAVGPTGDFVIVWLSEGSSGSDNSGWSIQGQRYSSQGTRLGSQFQVNSETNGDQGFPTVSVGSDGKFVIAWQSYSSIGPGGTYNDIQAQRYSSPGVPLGAQFEVDSYPSPDQRYPSVSVGPQGDFLIVWRSDASTGSDTSMTSIQARHYSSLGAPSGPQFQVNSYVIGNQSQPATALGMGGGVVVWRSDGSSGSDNDSASILAQRFAPATRTATSTATSSPTGISTSTSTPTEKKTSTPTVTPTRTATPTQTQVPTATPSPPVPVQLYLNPSQLRTSQVGLYWDQSQDPRFDRYELWRWSVQVLRDSGHSDQPWRWSVVMLLGAGLWRHFRIGPHRRRKSELASVALGITALCGAMLLTRPGRAQAGPQAPAPDAIRLSNFELLQTSHIDTGLQPNWSYAYQLAVVTSDGAFGWSNIVIAHTLPLPTPTPRPSSTPTNTPRRSATPTKTSTPANTATRTPPPTSTSTPCGLQTRTFLTQNLGTQGNTPRTWTIGDQVVGAATLEVTGTLCWNSEICGLPLVTVGPEGAPATGQNGVCPGNFDCELDPLPGFDNHGRFYYQVNSGPFKTVPQAGSFQVQGLKKGARMFLDVNDHHYENNTGGFRVTLRYQYQPNCGPANP
jgi:hypothetical protein